MRRLLVCLLLASLAAACGRARETEPNDHFTQASPLRSGRSAAGTLASASDVDVYRLEVRTPGQVLDVHVTGIRQADFILRVLDSDRRELKRFDETSAGGDERALDLGVEPGPYFVVLSNKNPSLAGQDQAYRMTATLGPGRGREREPNDRALLANPLKPGSGILRGHYFPSRNLLSEDGAAEEDWYLVDVEREGRYLLNIDLSEVPGVDPVLELYDLNAYMIKTVDAGGAGEPEVLRGFGVTGPMKVHLRVRTKGIAQNGAVPYELLTELVPYRGLREFEPNDQRLDATPFDGDSIEGTIAPAGDTDWYRISAKAEAKRILTANLGGLVGMDLRMSVTDDLGRPMIEIDDAGKERPEVLTGAGVAGGDYYLVVSAADSSAAEARRTYTLTKTLADFQPGLEYEVNDSSSTAQPIKVGASVDGYLAPKGDVDWYEFNVYAKAEIVLELTSLRSVRLRLDLFDQEYQLIEKGPEAKKGRAVTLVRELEPGTYALRLAAADPAESNVRDKYTLRLRAQ